MKTTTDAGLGSVAFALRDAIARRNEAQYRRTLMRFLGTREGIRFVENLLRKPGASVAMQRSYRRLAPLMGLAKPSDLIAWMDEDRLMPTAVQKEGIELVSKFLPYLRFFCGWARTLRKDTTYAIAMTLILFEPVFEMFESLTIPKTAGKSSSNANRKPKRGEKVLTVTT